MTCTSSDSRVKDDREDQAGHSEVHDAKFIRNMKVAESVVFLFVCLFKMSQHSAHSQANRYQADDFDLMSEIEESTIRFDVA